MPDRVVVRVSGPSIADRAVALLAVGTALAQLASAAVRLARRHREALPLHGRRGVDADALLEMRGLAC